MQMNLTENYAKYISFSTTAKRPINRESWPLCVTSLALSGAALPWRQLTAQECAPDANATFSPAIKRLSTYLTKEPYLSWLSSTQTIQAVT